MTVLDGVTGSGKTETYFAAIAAALAAGRQVLVLLPEIALGAQWLGRFRERFGVLPAQWHSDIGQAERRDTWRAVAAGRARVVVGARSALFLPFPELGLIVVDEEHDPSYKQEDGVFYQARDMAVLRASLAGIPIVLVSATPSLETVVNVARGRYQRVALPRRHAAAELPAVRLIDLRARADRARAVSGAAARCRARCDVRGRRAGAAFPQPAGLRAADFVPGLRPSLSMPELHRLARRAPLYRAAAVSSLRPCRGGAGMLPGMPCGRRSGAVRAGGRAPARGGRQRFPAARAALMVSDLLPGPRAAAELAQAMTERRYDVLIGTQIVAKGHHFPMLTLVGVVDADLGLDRRRSARRRANLSAVAPGRRPSRPRRA